MAANKLSRFPVAAFDPRMIQTLLSAAKGEKLVFDFPSIAKARAFQLRLNTLRSQMRKENDPRYPIVCRATTSLRNADGSAFEPGQSNDGPRQLWVLPRDHEFADVFEKAGLKIPVAESPAEGEESSASLPHDPLDDV